ncbi:hypothetical protein [Salinibius halmophilus]|uniref:hypothetical protein n=1 Tax=Salinibius halmophilus TaxID=1853216 RepID=UPI000E6614EB|nr:hypothetical protein [Salinibius halmophilus]
MAVDILILLIALVVGFAIGVIANCQLVIGLIFSVTGYRPLSETLACKDTFLRHMLPLWLALSLITGLIVWQFGVSVGAVLLAGFILGSIYAALSTLFDSATEGQ